MYSTDNTKNVTGKYTEKIHITCIHVMSKYNKQDMNIDIEIN